jgi:hypothetical protein
MTIAQFQSYHIERHAWFLFLTSYDAMYSAYYSVWRLASSRRSDGLASKPTIKH